MTGETTMRHRHPHAYTDDLRQHADPRHSPPPRLGRERGAAISHDDVVHRVGAALSQRVRQFGLTMGQHLLPVAAAVAILVIAVAALASVERRRALATANKRRRR